MLKAAVCAAVAAIGTMIVPSIGLACEGGKVLFEDKFETFSPAWGFTLDAATEKIDPIGLSFDYPLNLYRRAINQVSYENGYVACATITASFTCTNASQCESQGSIGLVILAADPKSFYVFAVSPAYSSYSLSRLQNEEWLTSIAWTALPNGKRFISGERFEMQATVKGSNMKFKVNGKDILEFDGVAPAGGSLVGFEVATYQTDTKNSQFTLSNLTVKELAP